MKPLVQKHAEKLRFGVVGVANTLLDFAILFLLVHMGLDKIIANYISTSIAFIFSFFVNRSFTFKAKGGNVKRQFVLFLLISIVGLWAIQPLIIGGISSLLSHSSLASGIILLIAKLLATIASLIWNYIMYARFVFIKKTEEE